MFEEAARRSVSRDNVVKAAATRADYTPRTYMLRSFLRCEACGLRMHGRDCHGVSNYVCETARRQATLVAPEHLPVPPARTGRKGRKVPSAFPPGGSDIQPPDLNATPLWRTPGQSGPGEVRERDTLGADQG
jgi:hypothetical protein